MSENDRLFCKMASGEDESEIVHGEEGVVDFQSIDGESVTRVLVVFEDRAASSEENGLLPEGRVRNMDVAESGYPIRINNGSDGGQEIFLRLHAHVMGSRKLERL